MAITDTSPDVKNIVLNLVKKYGTEKAIKMATGYGIPLEAVSFALRTPMGQGAVQDFNQMKSDLGGTIKGTVGNVGGVIKSAFSPNTTQPANQGIMAAGQQDLGQTQQQIAAQQASSQATRQGNYQSPIMSQQEMVREAQRTGGTVNPHEATKAVSRPRQPVYGPHGKAEGGIVDVLSYLHGGEVENIPHVEEKTTINVDDAKERIRKKEGYENIPYKLEYTKNGKKVKEDFYTVGRGHKLNINNNQHEINRIYDEKEIEELFEQDVNKAVLAVDDLVDKSKVHPKAYNFLVEMAFQMGSNKKTKEGLAGFEKTIAAINAGDYEEASNQMLYNYKDGEKSNTTWHNQTPERAKELSALMVGLSKNDSQLGGITNVVASLAGGGIMDYTNGGHAVGPGTATSDSIPAFLSDGEFVMTADAVKGFGGGNREQGAQKLYSMMRNAESGAKNTRRS